MPFSAIEHLFAQAAAQGDGRIVRSPRPQDLETPVALLDSWITPNDRFYVRSHLYTPSVDLATWTLAVQGDVERPLTLTMADLKRMPAVSLPVTLECAGNGRAFFEPPVAGVQWQKGAVGNARWTG
ncbi:MAG: molybdopterin-dependent oxidoreductase, partial [Vicinamibacterales bacterium]